MDLRYFEEQYCALCKILDNSFLPKKEIRYRKTELAGINKSISIAANTGEKEKYNTERNRFFQKSHEVKGIPFLQVFGQLDVAQDSNHEAGADFVLDKEIYIESVCSSPGDLSKSGLAKYIDIDYKKFKLYNYDYSELNRLINLRFTNTLYEKKDFYISHLNNKTIPSGKPYLVFLSPGILAFKWSEEENGFAFLDILFGRGNPTITVNSKTGEIIEEGYSHKTAIMKRPDTPVDCNLFYNQEYSCISGILLAYRPEEDYGFENVVLFTNPYADNPVSIRKFKGLTYWEVDESDHKYKAFKDGNILLESM